MVLKILQSFDLEDGLLVLGTISLLAGIYAIHKPSAAITFGVICLGFWVLKNLGRKV